MIAVALNTFDLDDDAARRVVEETERETGLPTTDPVRFDPAPIVDAIATFHEGEDAAVSRVTQWLRVRGCRRRTASGA